MNRKVYAINMEYLKAVRKFWKREEFGYHGAKILAKRILAIPEEDFIDHEMIVLVGKHKGRFGPGEESFLGYLRALTFGIVMLMDENGAVSGFIVHDKNIEPYFSVYKMEPCLYGFHGAWFDILKNTDPEKYPNCPVLVRIGEDIAGIQCGMDEARWAITKEWLDIFLPANLHNQGE